MTTARRKEKQINGLASACLEGNTKAFKKILFLKDKSGNQKYNPDINVNLPYSFLNDTTGKSYTLLQVACRCGCFGIVELLCNHPETNLNHRCRDGRTALYYACLCTDNYKVVEYLCKNPLIDINLADFIDGYTPLHIACRSFNLDKTMKALLQHNSVEVNISNNPQGNSPLHVACENVLGAVQLFCDDPRTNLNQQNNNGETPFYYACMKKKIKIIKYLCKNPLIDINLSNNNGFSPFHIACYLNSISVVKILLQQNSIQINKLDNTGDSVLHIACEKGNLRMVQLLCNDSRINLNQQNNSGETPFYRACMYKKIKVIKYLLKNPLIDVDLAANRNGNIPLHVACRKGYFGVVKLLCENSNNNDNSMSRFDIFERVWLNINQFVKFNQRRTTVMVVPSPINENEILFDKQVRNLNLRNNFGETPFYYACESGNLDIVKYIYFNYKISIDNNYENHITNNGSSPLYISCKNGNSKIVKFLFKNNIIVSEKNFIEV